MNWFQFRTFLIEQLEQFRISQNSKNFEDLVDLSESVVVRSLMDRSSHQVPHSDRFHDLHPDRDFNWKGAGNMFAQAYIRELKEIPVKAGIVGYSAGVHRLTFRTFYQAFSKIPLALFVGQLPRNIMLWNMYIDDFSSGKFPGTDDSFFV